MESIRINITSTTPALAEFQQLSVRMQVVSLAVVLTVLVNFIRGVVCWYRLRHVPGPFINAWTSWIQVWKIARGEGHLYYDELSKQYGESRL